MSSLSLPSWWAESMQDHPYFNLRLHTDEELAELTGGQIAERVTLHEWPLSCVQRVRLVDGHLWVYKAAWGPTVEAEFYRRALSPLVVPARTLYQQDGYSCLLIDWIEAPRLDESRKSEADLLQIGIELLKGIRELPADLPCYLDLRSAAGWQAVVKQIIEPLQDLHRAGKSHMVTPAIIQTIEQVCHQASVLDWLGRETGLVHGDLGGDNVFYSEDGYRVIDWQRPIYGPQSLDLVTLLESGGYDADKYVEPGILRLHRLLRIHWFVQCAHRWFPEGLGTYDRQITELAAHLEVE